MDIDAEEAEFLTDSENMRDIENPENNLMRDQLDAVITKAIADLPRDLRTAITLREIEGLSYGRNCRGYGLPYRYSAFAYFSRP